MSVAEEEVAGIGVENIEGHLVAWNYYQTTDNPENEEFVAAFKEEYGEDRVTADPIEAGYNAVYIWAAAAEEAGSFDVDGVAGGGQGPRARHARGPAHGAATGTSTSPRRPASASSTPRA